MAKIISEGTPIPEQEKFEQGSPYVPVNKRRTRVAAPGQTRGSDLQKALDRAKKENTRLVEQAQKRKEFTPLFKADPTSETLTAVYYGTVAGKTQTREVPIVTGDGVADLAKVLTPMIAVMNAAIQAKNLEEVAYKGEPSAVAPAGSQTKLYRATSLTKAAYAYQALLANDTFRQQLADLSATVDSVFQNLGVEPKDLKVTTRDDKDGSDWVNKTADLNRQVDLP